MSSNELSYHLLPADRYANTNFRHAFFGLAILETLLTSCNTSLCMTLAVCICTRQPFIFLHTSLHPFIQASIFMTASITQLFKLLMLVFCTTMVLLYDGEIFLSSAKIDIQPVLEQDQGEKSPNEVARRSFKNRQTHIRRLRKVIKFYPLIQLLCGSLSLAFWCTSDERHRISHSYYHQLEPTQAPSNLVFLLYLISWSIDLLVTPFFLLIATWHYSRVDWQIQILAAQETMDRNIDVQVVRRASRKRASIANNAKRKHRSMMGPHPECFKAVSPSFTLGNMQQIQHLKEREMRNQNAKLKDVNRTRAPVSVPVSPSSPSSSCKSSMFSSLQDATASDRRTASHDHVERKLMSMTAPISRRASTDLVTPALTISAPTSHHECHISAYLNVERGSEVGKSPTTARSRGDGRESNCFRIFIQADDSDTINERVASRHRSGRMST